MCCRLGRHRDQAAGQSSSSCEMNLDERQFKIHAKAVGVAVARESKGGRGCNLGVQTPASQCALNLCARPNLWEALLHLAHIRPAETTLEYTLRACFSQ